MNQPPLRTSADHVARILELEAQLAHRQRPDCGPANICAILFGLGSALAFSAGLAWLVLRWLLS